MFDINVRGADASFSEIYRDDTGASISQICYSLVSLYSISVINYYFIYRYINIKIIKVINILS